MMINKISSINLEIPLVIKWLKILRSPKARKAQSVLERADNPIRRCCLGHLCHVAEAEREENGINVVYKWKSSFSSSSIPLLLAKELDIAAGGNFIKEILYEDCYYSNLMGLNDGSNASLFDIARIIEDNIKNKNFRSYAFHYPEN